MSKEAVAEKRIRLTKFRPLDASDVRAITAPTLGKDKHVSSADIGATTIVELFNGKSGGKQGKLELGDLSDLVSSFQTKVDAKKVTNGNQQACGTNDTYCGQDSCEGRSCPHCL
ncbi:MAG TPA: hypothetical protein VLF93_05030 [Candidatus Saccharimonadales bacterium]|nr:hypothetical protein [Candidatus Saccharimonadales bacterium]